MVRRLALPCLGILAADIITKITVRSTLELHQSIPIIGDVVRLTHLTNTGAAFGILQNANIILMIIGIAAAAAVLVWNKKIAPWKGGDILSGLALGAILGNVLDRVIIGGVTDFIAIGPWPPFNIADATLTLCVIALIYKSR